MRAVPSLVLSTLLAGLLACQNPNERVDKKNPSEQVWQALVDGEWKATRKVYYTYNDRDELIEELMVIVSDTNETWVNRTKRFYDNDGKELKVLREMWRDSSWSFSIQSTFTYENERIDSRLDSLAPNGLGKLFYVNYTYNAEGELEAEITKREIKDSLSNSLKVSYQYDQYGSPIQKEFPIWKDNEWVNSRKMTLRYNNKQHHIQSTRYNWVNDEWVENIKYDLTVDQNGNRLSQNWKRLEGSEYNTFTRIKYTYN